MPAALTVVMLLSLASNPTAPTESKPKLLVLELTAPAALDPTIAKTLSEAVTAEVSRRGYFEVLSTGDIQTILGVERQRQLLGCSEGSSSCIAELAGAMGAQLTLSGSIGTLGDTFQLTLQTLDSIKGQTVGRSMRVTHSAETLRALLPSAVAEATGIPAPPGRSRVLPYSLLGVIAFTDEQVDELAAALGQFGQLLLLA